MSQKKFYGLGEEFDYDWLLTEEQKTLKGKLIDVCINKIRPHAIHCDRTYEFPRKSMEHLAELGLLSIMIPKELGGMGEKNVFLFTVIETISRYGCPSTALVYVMHVVSTIGMSLYYTSNPTLEDLLRRCTKEPLIGTIGSSDPATGGHFWYSVTSKYRNLDDNNMRILKYNSWMTSAGFADYYLSMSVIEDPKDYSKITLFLVYNDEVRASTSDWSALGVHGNQSGSLIVDGTFPRDRILGEEGEGGKVFEVITPLLIQFGVVGNGVSMGIIDLAKKHVTAKTHADTGKRVCDYETIQDYFGEAISKVNAGRSRSLIHAMSLDNDTNNWDYKVLSDPKFKHRGQAHVAMYEGKLFSSETVEEVSDLMLRACGGSGYKTDLGLERLFRDARATWPMAPSAEYCRQAVGKISLMGFESVDIWEHNCNKISLHHELNKMNLEKKKALAESLLEEIEREESNQVLKHPYQDQEFINPLNIAPPTYTGKVLMTEDGIRHRPALNPEIPAKLHLQSKKIIAKDIVLFYFRLINTTDYLGCLPGQYILVRVSDSNGRIHERHISPVSRVDAFGKLEIVIKYEADGFLSQAFERMRKGDQAEFLGPCGGFEYERNKLEELTLLVSGTGVTAGLQIIRTVMADATDKTNIKLIYYANTHEEMIYRQELEGYRNKDSRLRSLLTLGEVTEEGWEGEEGHIDTNMIKWGIQECRGLRHKVVICGGPTMITSSLHSLKSLKYPSENIFIYGYVASDQLRAVYGKNIKMSGHRCA